MAESQDQHEHVPIPATGLTVVYEPSGNAKPSLDVVFIHGFTGHPERTWTHKKGDHEPGSEPPSKAPRFSLLSTPHRQAKAQPVFWPRDLLPETLPDARILTYGYDTNLRHKVVGPPLNKSLVYDMANDFLVELVGHRKDPARPVLFIAHSLGGVMVKEALRQSSHQLQVELKSIFHSTIGIIFFGTPHRGADPRGFFLHTFEAVIKAVGVSANHHVVATLLPDSERLKQLKDEFDPIIQQQSWRIHSFQEGLGIQALGGCKVVDDSSSYLSLPKVERRQHIGRNHMDICRFTGKNDVEYQKVVKAVIYITEIVASNAAHMEQDHLSSLSEEMRKKLLASLKFDQIDSRQESIRIAHGKTCAWILKKQEYLDWLNPTKLPIHHGFLWMRGKPGSGKSTLMKFTLRKFQNLKRKANATTIIYFFFNARGAELEKTTKGMYRSLLLQLLEKLPHLHSVFESEKFGAWKTSGESYEWPVPTLEELFEDAILALGSSPVTCFIDALDECDETEIRAMIRRFQHIGEHATQEGRHFRIFLSSRYYPQITISKCLSLELDGQEGHTQDIDAYINSELQAGNDQAKMDLREKSAGVFMWVVLVVDILNKTPASMVTKKLKRIPRDLLELFRSILTKDAEDQDELRLCIQWLLFARSPLKPAQFYFALLSTDPDPETLTAPVSVSEIEKFIRYTSKGLAEITKSKSPVVQFIHESVRDFLLKENGLRELWPDSAQNLTSFEAQSHEALKRCCLGYLGFDFSNALGLGDAKLPKASSKSSLEDWTTLRERATEQFPLLEYATNNLLRHAEAAQAGGIEQKDFVRDYLLGPWFKTWLRLHNIIQQHDTRRYRDTLDTTLLYVLAELNLPNIITLCLQSGYSFLVREEERYATPFLAALACQSHDAAELFVESLAAFHNTCGIEANITLEDWKSQEKRIKLSREFSAKWTRSILSYTVEHGDEVLTRLLLNLSNIDVNDVDKAGRSPLSYAAEKGYVSIAKLLLKHGANLNLSGGRCASPFIWAVDNNHAETVSLFMEKGVDIDLLHHYHASLSGTVPPLIPVPPEGGRRRNKNQRTALSWAAQKGYTSIARLILEKGADVHGQQGLDPILCAAENGSIEVTELLLEFGADIGSTTSDRGKTCLHIASQWGHQDIVRCLFENGAELESCDAKGWTPVHYAARWGHPDVVRCLVEKGAELESCDVEGWTPLHHAVNAGYKVLVKLLLESGANPKPKDIKGQTSLHLAASNGNLDIIMLLLRHGAETEALDTEWVTPLFLAVRVGNLETIKLLLENGADGSAKQSWLTRELVRRDISYVGSVEVLETFFATGQSDFELKDASGRSLFSYAAQNGQKAIIQTLLASGKVEADSRDEFGRSPLSYAAESGGRDVCKLLIERGMVDPDSADIYGRSPLSYAAERGRRDIAELLLRANSVNVDSKDAAGRTPLRWAVDCESQVSSREVIEQILCTGKVDVNSRDETGETPVIRAVKKRRNDAVVLLLATGEVDLSLLDPEGRTVLDMVSLLLDSSDLNQAPQGLDVFKIVKEYRASR